MKLKGQIMWKCLSMVLVMQAIVPGTLCAAQASGMLQMEASKAEVARYGKLELLVAWDRRYDNPFDPQEVELNVVLTTPNGQSMTVPAFFCQMYERQQLNQGRARSDWIYPVGHGQWKARFAPMHTGTYRAMARLKDKTGIIESQPISFVCVASASRGFLGVCEEDPRFMAFSDGTPFFAIGQNLAFIGEGQTVTLSKAETIFKKLTANGANFLRIWTGCHDWAMAIEARKSAWNRSWSRDNIVMPMPGLEGDPKARHCVKIESQSVTVAPSHPVALRPNTSYVIAGRFMTDSATGLRINLGGEHWETPVHATGDTTWQAFTQEFTTADRDFWLGQLTLGPVGSGTIWLDSLSLKEAGHGPELLWEADVNRPALGVYNQVDCFMLDKLVEAAQDHGIYLMLCLLTRDLYMKHLADASSRDYDTAIRYARQFMRYAVARWGYATSVAAWEYFNEIDPGLPTDRFYTEVGHYVESIDIYHHLRATSTWHPSARDCALPCLDLAQVHRYMRPGTEEAYQDEVAVVLDRAEFLRKNAPNKPSLIAEFGLADAKWGRSDYMKQDSEGVHFHTSLWASAFSGTSGTAMFWWWELLDEQDAYRHYKPLSAFLADVCFAGLGLTGATVSDGQVRVLGYQGDACAYLWISDSRATWWRQVAENKRPAPVTEGIVTIGGLKDGTYQIEWWDTFAGGVLRTDHVSCREGRLQGSMPPFSRDIACKIRPK
ncbi:MAG: DUF5060 domain-containing protein [Phycisphaerae bacterium]|nr:DUF5060 domain-containing protein [Phycisphaerae bacterium]